MYLNFGRIVVWTSHQFIQGSVYTSSTNRRLSKYVKYVKQLEWTTRIAIASKSECRTGNIFSFDFFFKYIVMKFGIIVTFVERFVISQQ